MWSFIGYSKYLLSSVMETGPNAVSRKLQERRTAYTGGRKLRVHETTWTRTTPLNLFITNDNIALLVSYTQSNSISTTTARGNLKVFNFRDFFILALKARLLQTKKVNVKYGGLTLIITIRPP